MRSVVELAARLVELEHRLANLARHGTVHSVDAAAGTVRLAIGESEDGPLLSPPIPYGQIAGALKVHSPPSVGQQMTLVAPSGDPRQGVALPMTWSDANASPSDKGDEHVVKIGSVTMTLKGDGLTLSVGGVSIAISGSGVAIEGGNVTHDGKNIGSDHRHTEVMPGAAETGPPA
jgi:phage baseplate assembly protein gpV